MAEHCPTCGQPVRVAGEGMTHYYRPGVDLALIERALQNALYNETSPQHLRLSDVVPTLRQALAHVREVQS